MHIPKELTLDKALKFSYKDLNHQKNMSTKYGYKIDSMLSNKNEHVYFNPKENKLVITVAGTDKFSPKDLITDVYLAAGKLKDTSRYKSAHKTIRDAKAKYNVDNATLAGHSLGGSIVSYAGSTKDNIITLDKGATIGTKTRSREKAYRSAGDAVSALAANAKNMTTLGKNNYLRDGVVLGALKAHNVSNIANEKIYI